MIMKSKNGIILKILSIFKSGLFIKIHSVFISDLWVAGVILSNVYIIILTLILLAALSMVLYIHHDNLKEIFQRQQKEESNTAVNIKSNF